MAISTSPKKYAEKLITMYGKKLAKKELSEAINDLSKDGHAHSNKNQILFFTKTLFKIN